MNKLLLVLTMFFAATVMAAVPHEINYQGKLTEYGTPVTGTRTMRFYIFRSANGTEFEWGSGDIAVNVSSGVFSCILSPDIDWRKKDLWIETIVSGKTLSPREKLTAQPFAMHAESAEGITRAEGETIEFRIGNERKASLAANGDMSSLINGTTYYMVPRGAIIMWSGTSIPTGWALCDGNNGTPDLRNRFVVGAGVEFGLNATGGSLTHLHTVDPHTHNIAHTHAFSGSTTAPDRTFNAGGGATSAGDGAHIHSYSGTTATASSQTSTAASPNTSSISHLPPYFALSFIMKL